MADTRLELRGESSIERDYEILITAEEDVGLLDCAASQRCGVFQEFAGKPALRDQHKRAFQNSLACA